MCYHPSVMVTEIPDAISVDDAAGNTHYDAI